MTSYLKLVSCAVAAGHRGPSDSLNPHCGHKGSTNYPGKFVAPLVAIPLSQDRARTLRETIFIRHASLMASPASVLAPQTGSVIPLGPDATPASHPTRACEAKDRQSWLGGLLPFCHHKSIPSAFPPIAYDFATCLQVFRPASHAAQGKFIRGSGPVFPGGYGVQRSDNLLSTCQRTSPTYFAMSPAKSCPGLEHPGNSKSNL